MKCPKAASQQDNIWDKGLCGDIWYCANENCKMLVIHSCDRARTERGAGRDPSQHSTHHKLNDYLGH